MKLLLDAHTFLWWVTASIRLSPSARRAIGDPANDVAVGAGSLWEISIKRALGKLDFPVDFETALRDEGFEVLPIKYAHLRALERLPFHHGDPFDRLLIAQAIAEGAAIVTSDRAMRSYEADTLW